MGDERGPSRGSIVSRQFRRVLGAGSDRRDRPFVALALVAFVATFLVFPPQTVPQGAAAALIFGAALTMGIAKPGPNRAVVCSVTFDVVAVAVAFLAPAGVAATMFFPYLGAVLLVPEFRGRALIIGFAVAWASGVAGFVLALTLGPIAHAGVLINPPIAISLAALTTILGYGALWWVADGLRRSAAAAAESSRQERRLAAAVAQAGDMIIVEGAGGRIEYVNPAFVELTGFPAEEAIGRSVSSLVRSGEHSTEFYRELDSAIRRGEPWVGRVTGQRRDGSPIVQALKVSPLHDPEGRLIGAVRVSRDLTQEIELENRLRQTAKMEAVGQLAGGVAHDFNNILTAISGYAEIIQATMEPGTEVREDTEQVILAAGRARDLTRQLLTFARKTVLDPQTLDPGRVVAGFAPMLRRLLGEHIQLVVSDRGGGSIQVDPTQLEQTILNLAVNARDAMPGGGTLQIDISRYDLDEASAGDRADVVPGPYVCVAVSDTGVGMDEATRRHIFEPFFTTKAPGEGTGMGLATVFGIVTMAGGWIDVDSEPGRGTTFRTYFPKVAEIATAASEATQPAPDPAGVETVLLVEDDTAVRSFAERTLRGLGYRVIEAATGQAALDLVAAGLIPDVLLTDVVMPGIQGPALANRVRATLPRLPVLFVSGFTDHPLLPQSETNLSSAYLAKPYRRTELAQAIRALLDQRADSSPAAPATQAGT